MDKNESKIFSRKQKMIARNQKNECAKNKTIEKHLKILYTNKNGYRLIGDVKK